MCDLQVVGRAARSVSAYEETVLAEGFARDSLYVGQPLGGEGGPLESATACVLSKDGGSLGGGAHAIPVHDVVKEDAVLFPDLILLVDELVLQHLLRLKVLHGCDVNKVSAVPLIGLPVALSSRGRRVIAIGRLTGVFHDGESIWGRRWCDGFGTRSQVSGTDNRCEWRTAGEWKK